MIYVSTKSNKKPRNSKKKRDLQDSWKQICSKWEGVSISGQVPRPIRSNVSTTNTDRMVHRRNTDWDNIPSLDTGVGIAPKKESPQYTGENMIGIGQLHKSNAIPVFKQEDAEDLARMRR